MSVMRQFRQKPRQNRIDSKISDGHGYRHDPKRKRDDAGAPDAEASCNDDRCRKGADRIAKTGKGAVGGIAEKARHTRAPDLRAQTNCIKRESHRSRLETRRASAGAIWGAR